MRGAELLGEQIERVIGDSAVLVHRIKVLVGDEVAHVRRLRVVQAQSFVVERRSGRLERPQRSGADAREEEAPHADGARDAFGSSSGGLGRRPGSVGNSDRSRDVVLWGTSQPT